MTPIVSAVEAIGDGEHVFIYDDGLFADIAKDVGKELKGNFKKRKIKWTVKSEKSGTFKSILSSFDKDVIKKKPQIVVLSFGLYHMYNPKKKELLRHVLKDIESDIVAVHEKIKAANARLVLITPGLCSEDLSKPQHMRVNALARMIVSYAKSNEVAVVNIHESAEQWLKANPPKKKGRNQLTKDGYKWDKDGKELIRPKFMRALGLSGGNGINRPIKWDERIVIHAPLESWILSFPGGNLMENRLAKDLKAAGPKEAPAGFNRPGVNGPNCVLGAYKEYPEAYAVKSLTDHKPTVAFVYPLFGYGTRKTVTDTSRLDDYVEEMMKAFAQQDFPIYVMTHLWGVEDGEKALSKGTRYERCKHTSELVNKYANKYNVEVIDLFALCEQIHKKNKVTIFGKEFSGESVGNVYPSLAGKQMMFDEIKRVLGLIEESDEK